MAALFVSAPDNPAEQRERISVYRVAQIHEFTDLEPTFPGLELRYVARGALHLCRKGSLGQSGLRSGLNNLFNQSFVPRRP